MSGIFRSTSANNTSETTPNKRFSFSAFCTSPGTLQDVTMENSYGVGYRSPCVSLQQQYLSPTSPSAQGRSVREFEEQMASLRKENFNLKLRLYFIEESIPGYKQSNPQDGQESLMKQLIDSKVEMEILRKEIQEKQDILKEAAQAMNQMEEMQKETESKNAVIVEELKQKIQYFEMERDMDKSHSGDFMNDMLGRSDMSENLNALQKIRELEEVIKKYEDKMGILQAQVHKLDEVLAKRDETILEYEEKVKEIVFQNAELLESLENKEKESINAERKVRGLRMSNSALKDDNQKLICVLKVKEDTFCKEISHMKTCEKQIRDQQDTLSKMQSTISIKNANTAKLLERIQEYEKMVTKINIERNLTKRENRFFRAIINKLQNSNHDCFAIGEENKYQALGSGERDPSSIAGSNDYDRSVPLTDSKSHGDYQETYKWRPKLSMNFKNSSTHFNSSIPPDKMSNLEDFASDCCTICELESHMPFRCTISDASLISAGSSRPNSYSSLKANCSSSSARNPSREISSSDIFLKDEKRSSYSPSDGIRYVFSKFGKFQ